MAQGQQQQGQEQQQEQQQEQEQRRNGKVHLHEPPPTGRRVFDGLEIGQRQPFLNAVVAVVSLALYCGWVNILILLGVASFFWPKALLLLIGITSTLLLPAKPVLWPAFNRLWVFRTWREYFRFSYHFEEALDMNKQYVLFEVPHGTFPIGPVCAATLVQTLFPDAPVYSLAATSVFHIPLWRHFIAWIGSLPASRANFLKLLREGKSVGVVVGGIAEMFMEDEHVERVMLAGRKGFIRVAVESGLDGGLVPVYYLGQSRVFSFGPAFLAGISRKWRVSIGILYGRWGLPFPRPTPIYLVHGKPIPVPKVSPEDPLYEKTVNELHEKCVDAIQGLYNRHREEYGWADRPLRIE